MAGKTTPEISESGNWNVARHYSEEKIMKYLVQADQYETIAKFGATNAYEEFEYKSFLKAHMDERRISGFKWLVHSLLTLIGNAIFALDRKPKEKQALEKAQEKLQEIEEDLDNLYTEKLNQVTKQKGLKLTDKFKERLKEVCKIKVEINEPLNKADLIFIHKKSFNPKEFKRDIFDRATTRG